MKACYISQTALWNMTEIVLVCVAFREIKADILFLSLEPVPLRTSYLESNIYESDINISVIIFSLANLKCQMSLQNLKGWQGQRRGAEVVFEPFGTHIGGLLVDRWFAGV